MRVVILSFLIFLCGVFLLTPHLNLVTVQIPLEYFLYATVGILFLTIFLQVEAMSFFRQKAAYIELNQHYKKLKSDFNQLKKTESEQRNQYDHAVSVQKKSQLEKDRLQDLLESAQRTQLRFKNELEKNKVAFTTEVRRNKKLREDLIAKEKQDAAHKNTLTLLSLLQEKGRFVDFIMEDMTSFSDDQVGTAARFVHQGCRKVFQDYFEIVPICAQEEGETISVLEKEATKAYRFVGEGGESSKNGKVVHRGWQTKKVDLPQLTGVWSQQDLAILSPAEIDRIN